jgi:gliding motility-associated-like protein
VEITPCQDEVIWIPSAFTPNGDNRNDIFRVMGNISSKEFSLQIYNRWGELIFESNDVEIGWNGTYKGTLVQDDIYTYKVFCLVNSRYFLKYGSVTLIR